MSQNAPVWRVGRALLLALVFIDAGISSALAQRQLLSGHVPQAVKSLNLQPLGQLPATNVVHLAIGLPLRDAEAAKAFVQQLYDPASPLYHQYLTPEQFSERFGPTPDDYQKVVDFAASHGFSVTHAHRGRLLLDVDAAAGDVEQAFQVKMFLYQHPTEARTFYAPDAEPSIPSGIKILDVSGISSYPRPHPMSHVGGLGGPASTPIPNAGSNPWGEYIGNDFRAAYVPGSPLTGAGQSVALVQFDNYYASDITRYETMAGLPSVTLSNIMLDSYTGTIGSGNGEVSLDIEMVISMAPRVSMIYLYEGNPAQNFFNPNDVLQQIANDDNSKQISCSWGWTGGPTASTDDIFIQMMSQGQTFFVASGDSDAYPGSSVDNVCSTCFGTPSASAYVTSVGGTTLSTAGPTNNWTSETVWNWGVEYAPNDNGVGSSGGYSSYYSIPTWQQGVPPANLGSTSGRNFPDVAMTGDHVFVTYGNGTTNWFGGTSCASPLWAGFMALVNQQGVAGGDLPVGFLNPAIYSIGTGTTYAACFHDITTGNNEWSNSPSAYTALTGYDLCTGWGTPTGTNLINTLTGPVAMNPLMVADGWTLLTESCTPTNGGIDPDETVTVNFILENVGTASTTNLVATLLATGGAMSPNGPQTYGVIAANGGVATQSFTFTANASCGGVITNTFQLQDGAINLGTATFILSVGGLGQIFAENFDGVTPTNLPAGWTTSAGGAESPWVTSTTQRDTLPNAAFSPDPGSIGSNALVSPVIPIASAQAQLTFRNNYSLEAGLGTTAYDGGVLEIEIGGGAFQDILAAGGTFTANGYNRTISSSFGNPLAGRQAWSGNSGGFVTTAVNLPATAAGQYIQLRWRCGTDNSVSKAGWYIDTVFVSDLACCTGVVYQPPPVAGFTAAPTNGVAPLAVTFADMSTGSVTNWSWNFGDDGTTNVNTNDVVYTYNTAGVYTVTEIVSGSGGSSTNTQSNYITVLTAPPVASFTAAPTNGVAPLSVTFTDASTGSITNWAWDFGDGGTTNVNTNHAVYAYNTAGVYTVTEIVTGPGGSSTNTQPNYIVVLTPFQGWQIQYFGSTNNPNAAPAADADGTGQNNLFKFAAGLDPTNPASVFLLTIISDTNQPNAQDLQFTPMVGGRTYTPQFNTDLVNGVWLPLATYTGPVTNGNQITVTDTNALPPQEFYRIDISLP